MIFIEVMLISQRWEGSGETENFLCRFLFWKTILSFDTCLLLSPYWGIDTVKLFAALLEMFQLLCCNYKFKAQCRVQLLCSQEQIYWCLWFLLCTDTYNLLAVLSFCHTQSSFFSIQVLQREQHICMYICVFWISVLRLKGVCLVHRGGFY